MKIGCPKEIKPQEFRVGLTPAAAREAVTHGHHVLVETGAGQGAGFDDADYTRAGAEIAATADEVFASADMIVKVKEPQAAERAMLREGQVLFTYLHLAPDPDQTRDLLNSGVTAIAYETVTDAAGGLPLLAPMSEVAGRLAPQVGAWALQKANGGRGVLMGGVPGVGPAEVVVIGGGVVGTQAARIASGMGADVTILDRSLPRLRYLDDVYRGAFTTRYASADATAELIRTADMVIGAVLVPGAAAPKLVTRAQLSTMKAGAVIVDVAIDQGGCFETSRATSALFQGIERISRRPDLQLGRTRVLFFGGILRLFGGFLDPVDHLHQQEHHKGNDDEVDDRHDEVADRKDRCTGILRHGERGIASPSSE
jgi:alanine dehydrogenase